MRAEQAGDGGIAEGAAAPRVPGYRVVRRLGAGGSGAVWLLEDDDGARRAVKVPHVTPGRGGPESHPLPGDSLRGERWRVQGLDHPHLLRLHGLMPVDVPGPDGSDIRMTGVLMDFAAGGSVGSLVAARGVLSAPEVVTVTVPVAEALAALHAKGIVHGDVSGGNILFSAEGVPLLADFGQAHLTGERRLRRATPVFADPEARESGSEGDVYALAAVAWWCLTGESPGPVQHRPPLPVLRPEVPPELAAALEEALTDRPDDRPSARDFARAVQRSAPAMPVRIAPGAGREDYRELATSLMPSRSGAVRYRSVRRRLLGHRQMSRRPVARRVGSTRGRVRSRGVVLAAVALATVVLGVALAFLGVTLPGGWMADGPGPGAASPGQEQRRGVAAAEAVPPSPKARPPAPPAAPAPPSAVATRTDPVEAARRLLSDRSAALIARDAARLESVYGNADGALRSRDRALIGRLVAGHRHYVDYRPVLSAAAVDSGASAARAVLSVTIRTPSYVVSGDAGAGPAPAERMPARREDLILTLVRESGGWRIAGVAPRG
ncbi:protein kinase [Arthrobacter sp. Y-9]|uniref:protein kinase domain-containing protein n=1 Tax=Arthrobacter sp. Y-9 TaxID=3039385 RepID=UPI00241D9558|nr:protein kinase [Arthrobacter sp. Y-9]WFR85319.1 protein kinase [Arthrobacter sp. Y-9]